MPCPKEITNKLTQDIENDIKERYGLKSLSNLNKKQASKIVNEMNNSIYNERVTRLSYEQDMGEKGLASIEISIPKSLLNKALIEASIQEEMKVIEFLNKDEESRISNQALEDQDRDFEDVNVDIKEYEKIPFVLDSADKIKKGLKSITIRSKNYKSNTYRLDNKLVNIFNNGLINIEEYLKKTGKTKEQIRKEFSQNDELKEKHIKDWFDNKIELFVYDILPVTSYEDVMVDSSDNRFVEELKRLNSLEKVINNLIKKGNLSEEDKEFYTEERKKVKEKIKELSKDEKQILNTIISQAYDNIKTARNILSKGLSDKSIKLATSYILGYTNLLHQFEVEGKQKLEVDDVTSQVIKLLNEINDAKLKLTKSKFEKESGKSWVDKVMDIGKSSLYTLSASANPTTLVQTINKVIKAAETKINLNFRKFEDESSKLIKELEDFTKLKGAKATEFMIQKDSEGNPTGYIVGQYTQQYISDKKSSENGDFLDHIKWLVKNHSFEIDQEVWEQKKKDIENSINNSADIIATDKKSVEQIKKEMIDNIIKANDPTFFLKYLEKINNNKATDTEIQYVHKYLISNGKYSNKGWYHKGKELISKNPIDKYKDKEYTKIQSLPDSDPRKKFYNYYVEKTIEARKMIALSDDITIPYSYIPAFEKTSSFWSNIPDKIKNQISQKVRDFYSEVTDMLTGEVIKNIPVYSLDNELKADEKNYDLTKVLQGFYYEALNKKYKEEIEDDVNLYLAALKNIDIYEVDKAGNIQYETINGKVIPKTKKNAESNNYLQAKYLIDAQLYGDRQDIELNTKKKVYNSEENKKINNFKKLQKERGVTEEQINKNLYYGLNETEESEYKNIIESGGQTITGNKIVNFLINLTAKKALGFNLLGGVTEYIQGFISMHTEAAAGTFFNDKNFWKANKLMIKSNNPAVDSSKVDKMLELFNLRESFNINYDDKNNIIDKAMFWHLRKAEKQVKGTIMLAILDNTVYEKDNTLSLLDIVDVKNGQLTVKDGYEDVFIDKDGNPSKLRIDLENKIQIITKKISSRDNSKDPINANKYALGRLLGQFRQSWMFEAVENRFGAEKEILGLDIKTKGFYRSVFYTNDKLNLSKGFKILYLSLMNKDTELEELDARNAKKMVREISWMLTSYGVFLATSIALSGDDDDDENPLLKSTLTYLLNQSYRTNRDLTFYISPESGQEITKNIIPAGKTLADAFSLIGAIKDIPFGDIYLYEGTKREELKVWNKTKKALPVIGVPDRIYKYLTDKTYTQAK